MDSVEAREMKFENFCNGISGVGVLSFKWISRLQSNLTVRFDG